MLQPAAKLFKKSFSQSAEPRRCFLINMDFAFGAQADYITHGLILAFGRAIRSFNVMGKAGALVGNRGDVQLPTSIIFSKSALGEDSTDENRSCGNEDLLASRLRELSGPSLEVHVGPVLTIPGTLLQNEKLLRFYRTVIGCVGLEMEGTYFARQLEEAIETGLLSAGVRRRFAYYTSDLPLRTQQASLSKPLAPNEGIPPMYSIHRAILERIFIDCAERQHADSRGGGADELSSQRSASSSTTAYPAAAAATAGGAAAASLASPMRQQQQRAGDGRGSASSSPRLQATMPLASLDRVDDTTGSPSANPSKSSSPSSATRAGRQESY